VVIVAASQAALSALPWPQTGAKAALAQAGAIAYATLEGTYWSFQPQYSGGLDAQHIASFIGGCWEAIGGTPLPAPGTAGNVLTSTGTVWASQTPSGGGATYGPYSSRPSPGTSGRLYIPSDGPETFVDTGSAWLPLVPGAGTPGSEVAPGNTSPFTLQYDTGHQLSVALTQGGCVALNCIGNGANNYYFQALEETITAPTTTTSSGFTLPQASIAVASVSGFTPFFSTVFLTNSTTLLPIAGTLKVTSSNGTQYITYTGISGNTFTGCVGGTGTVSNGATVTGQVGPSAWMNLSIWGSASSGGAEGGVYIRDSVSDKAVLFSLLNGLRSTGQYAPEIMVTHVTPFVTGNGGTTTNAVVFNGNGAGEYTVPALKMPVGMRIRLNGGTYYFEYSTDGFTWIEVYSETATTYVPSGGNRCGAFLNPDNISPIGLTLYAWDIK
jgi:hypothetical protein